MPEAPTKHFAAIHYDEGAVLTFPAGLPAFEHHRRFVLLDRPATAPVVFLQSLDDSQVCLPAVPVRAIDPSYELTLTKDDLNALEANSLERLLAARSLACLAVIAANETGPVTANLAAPLVVNLENNRAVQAVRGDARYSYVHPIHARGTSCL